YARYLQLVEQYGPGDKLLGGHSRIKIKPDILRSAVRSGYGEFECDGSPTRHPSGHHRTFLNVWSDCTYNPPLRAPRTNQLALVLPFKFIRPWSQHDELRDAMIVDSTVGKIH